MNITKLRTETLRRLKVGRCVDKDEEALLVSLIDEVLAPVLEQNIPDFYCEPKAVRWLERKVSQGMGL